MDYKARIGETSASFQESITPDLVAQFRRSIPGAARAEGTPAAILASFRKGEKELTERLGFELPRMLHAEQDYEFFSELPVEQEIQYQSRLLSVLEKRARDARGGMLIFSIGTDYRVGGRVFASAKSTVIYRTGVFV